MSVSSIAFGKEHISGYSAPQAMQFCQTDSNEDFTDSFFMTLWFLVEYVSYSNIFELIQWPLMIKLHSGYPLMLQYVAVFISILCLLTMIVITVLFKAVL